MERGEGPALFPEVTRCTGSYWDRRANAPWEISRTLALHALVLFFAMVCNFSRGCESKVAGTCISAMKPLYQIVAATMLLLFLGASGADCLVPNARMSSAEKACCLQMAGQCDMNMAGKHPCCRKIVRHDDAELNDLAHFTSPPLSSHVAMLEPGFSLHVPVWPSAPLEQSGGPPHDPPSPSVEILRI
jgi:hypothetical protein